MKPNVISLTPQGHFFQLLYHKTVRGMSSLKTSSSLCYSCIFPCILHSGIRHTMYKTPSRNLVQLITWDEARSSLEDTLMEHLHMGKCL